MWLDRLAGGPATPSGPSTPQPASRPSNATSRRTSSNLSPYVTSHRQGHSPRTSSVSLFSSDPTQSLLASSQRPNGTGVPKHATPDGQPSGPTAVLQKLLGVPVEGATGTQHSPDTITEADLELEVELNGMSLKQMASMASQDHAPNTLRRSQNAEDYEKDKSKFENLHRSISACDDVLRSVETNLASFRNDLAAVSADIESLQARSTALNQRLENRRSVEKVLGPLVDDFSVSPDTINRIVKGHIDESWAKVLVDVDRRATAHKKRSAGSEQSKASSELGPLLEKLILKAIERIRDFLVTQVKALRSPNINAQIIQQHNFLRFKDLFTFLHRHHAALADEISHAYMNTMRWYYANQFSRYEKALGKMRLHILDKNDALGHEELSRKATVLSSSRMAGPPHDAFSLGRRIDVVRARNQGALASYLAEEDQSTHYLEVPFRNFNLALIDNATAEYTFLASFFAPALPLSRISKNFNYIFEPTFELGRTLSKSLVAETYDALGTLMCIRLNQHFAFELQRRKVPAVDGYINGTTMLLWPRLQMIMDRHCESVRGLTNALPAKPSKSTSDSAKMSAAPHVVTQRFGQLLQGFLMLSTEAGDDEPVVTSLQRLRSETEAFLARHALGFGSDKRKSERFLYNNYSLILTIISDIAGKLAAEQQEHFEKLKSAFEEAA